MLKCINFKKRLFAVLGGLKQQITLSPPLCRINGRYLAWTQRERGLMQTRVCRMDTVDYSSSNNRMTRIQMMVLQLQGVLVSLHRHSCSMTLILKQACVRRFRQSLKSQMSRRYSFTSLLTEA